TLPGTSEREIVVVAHHDQSPDTVEGADNDGSGIAILLQLGRIFAAEGKPRHSLVLVATDGEEYGMLGTRRFIKTHPHPGAIIAGVSLDNLGKRYYHGLDMSPIGQFRGYGPLWLLRMTRAAARAAGDLWVPRIRAPVDQILNQAVPFSFMDQGPMVAAGVPAFGFAGLVEPEHAEDHWQTY
ncbi:MAG: Zn-dependent exopeptidase M28, partial [bacterium]|nr:Zn-dependent exopeptidase M28 [bacterium]